MKKITICLCIMCLICGALYAANQVVTNNNDSGLGSLREAISAVGDGEEITFNITNYTGDQDIVTITSELTISKGLNIDGYNNATGNNITVKVTTPGTTAHRIFHINASGETISISNMTIQGGDVTFGGSIYNEYGTTALDNVTVSESKAAFGGGIYNCTNGTLSISNSLVTENGITGTGCGGGIYNEDGGTISSIIYTTVSNNYAWDEGGGGIYNEDTGVITSISSSTISENTGYIGGGLRNDGTIGSIFNCTISTNTCTYDGGGIFNLGTITGISRCTIAENHADNDDLGSDNYGGGFYSDGTQTFSNTLLANNYRGSGTSTGDDYYYYSGTLTDNGYNIVKYQSDHSTGSNKTFTSATDILYNTKADGSTGYSAWNRNNTDLGEELYLSSTLALNNNPYGTYTHTFTDGTSLGIDDGSGSDTDQRGAAVYNSVKDIGAYEWEGSPGTLPVELSAFTAQYIENTPTIYWSTQSETDNMGWFICRNNESDFSSSKVISKMIEGHGTTTEQQFYTYEDNLQDAQVGDSYHYWLESIDYSGLIHHYNKVAVLTIPEHNDPGNNGVTELEQFGLFQNEPNPFISSTRISFNLHETAKVNLAIYNLKGEFVKNLYSGNTSKHTVTWNGKDDNEKQLENGVYFYTLTVNGKTEDIKKLILMK